MLSYIDFIGKEYVTLEDEANFAKHFQHVALDKIDDYFYVTNMENGIEVNFSEELICQVVHFYSGRYLQFKQFSDVLPSGLSFDISRKEIALKFGAPDYSGGGEGEANIYFGKIPPWDKYVYDDYTIHLQYDSDESAIDLITLMSPFVEASLEKH